ncbi:MAG: hypothetical protein DHS20C14_18900 [Phycisphaeraceae bacterium]|nr:MAG: hypothetical protein DHS20C14_18900 [Phycisphaeraceae bacterium]
MDQATHRDPGSITRIHSEPDRTSITAIFSLICSFICCLPLVPLLGAGLGVLALIGIGRSDGRVGGKGLAVCGIVLGIIVTLLQVGGFFLLDTGLRLMVREGNTVGQALTDLEADRPGPMRSILAGPLGSMTDAELAEFRDAYTADMGPFVSTPQTPWALLGGYIENEQLMKPYQNRPGLMPITATFSNGAGLLVVITDTSGRTPNAGGTNVPVTDLVLVSPAGLEYTLSDFDGPDTLAPGATAPADDPASAPEGELPDEGPNEGP